MRLSYAVDEAEGTGASGKLQRKRLQERATDWPPTRVCCVPGQQLSQRVPVGEQAHLQPCCVRSIFSHHQEDLDKSCTASGTDVCLHLAELSPCNNFLWVIIELRETRLALGSLRGRVVALDSNKQRRCPFILVHCPLMEHRSIEFLELRESRMSPKQFQLTDNLIHARLH
ncbi:uncharacterized protein LOC142568518 [Dermacentor variabilis]|uniref:uncharacterized protein LOC142568518 n=1 Tax=Dermacentor variabilis TaxID=34621 RepID=UPI003F5C2570